MGCSSDGCDKPVQARGLCSRHYRAWQRAGKPDGAELAARVARTCEVPDCTASAYARGHCERHYRQLVRSGAVQPDVAPTECAADGCDRRAVTRGWCHGHYLRWSRTGNVQAEVPLVRPAHDVCTVEGCTRGAHSATLCRTHHKRQALYGDPLAGGPIRIYTGKGSLSHGYWWMPVTDETRHLVPDDRRNEFEHWLVMARVIGRPLSAEETVHHRNGDRLDNRPENLELCSTAQPKGQSVADKVAFARRILALYADAELPDHSE